MNGNLKKVIASFSVLAIGFLILNSINVASFILDPGVPLADTEKPIVSITSPSDGATVSETFTIRVSASDNVAVDKVYFYIDGNYIGYDSTYPYKKGANTASYANGLHTIKVTAIDTSGNYAFDTHSITFYTPPPPDTTPPSVTITSPVSENDYPPFTEVSGIVKVCATATDNVAVDYVSFSIENVETSEVTELGVDYDPSYEILFDSTVYPFGHYKLHVKAFDTSGNFASDLTYITICNPSEGTYTLTYSYNFHVVYNCAAPDGSNYNAWIEIDMTAELTYTYTEEEGYQFTYSAVTYKTSWDEIMLSPYACTPVISNRIDFPESTTFEPDEDGFAYVEPFTYSKEWEETESATWPDGGPYSRVVLAFIVVGNNKFVEYETTIFFESVSGRLRLTERLIEDSWQIWGVIRVFYPS